MRYLGKVAIILLHTSTSNTKNPTQTNPTQPPKMQFSLLPLLLAAATTTTTVSAIRVSYDEGYDDPSRSLTSVACSDGPNGLITTHGFQTQGQIPGFPNIGGSFEIAGWGSAQVRDFLLSYFTLLYLVLIGNGIVWSMLSSNV